MKFNRILAVCIFALACLNAPFLIGQTGGGAVVGTVRDSSGAVIPKAKVVLTNTQTGVAITTQSTSAGAYSFPTVPVGTYTITTSAAGFQQTVSNDVVVALAKTDSVDVRLQIGAASSTVTVEAVTAQLQATDSQNATTIDQQTYDNLPFALTGGARSVTAVATIMPGVSMNDGASYQAPGTVGSQVYAESISGGQAWAGAQVYDGLPLIGINIGGDFRAQPVPVEALGEFSLVQNNYNPEIGQTPGGVLTYSTRAGTNAFHGQAYEYIRNNDLDAAGYFAPGPGAAVTHQNEFGVNVGGPIIIPHLYNGKDKLFFFGFYSGFRLTGSAPFSGETVPTLAERSGDFTGLLNSSTGQQIPIYDPNSCPLGDTTCTRTQFQYNGVLNVIPPNEIQSAAQTWNKYLLTPQNSALSSNVYTSGVNDATEDRWGGRIDYHLNENNQVYGFFAFGPVSSTAYSFGFQAPMNTYGASTSPNYTGLVRLGWDHTFTPNVLLHLGAGYNRQGLSSSTPYNTLIDYGIPNNLPGVTPSIYFLPGSYADNAGSSGSTEKQHAYLYSGYVSWAKGKNQFKFGAMWWQARGYNLNVSSTVDRLSPLETGIPSNSTSGDPYASLLVGWFDSYLQSDSPFAVDDQYQYFDGYFNDDYKMSPNLTINVGIRYEIPWTTHVKNNVASTFSNDATNPGAGDLPGALIFQGHGVDSCQCNRFAATRYVFWQPRVGFAYKVDDKTVVRGGYGLFLSLTGSVNENGYSTQVADGFNAQPQGQSPNSGITPAFTNSAGYPSFTPPPVFESTYDNGASPWWIQKNSGLPGIVSNYSLSLQRELPHSFILDIAYVGNTGQHLSSKLDLPNQLPVGDLAEYGASTLSALITSPQGIASGVPIPFPNFVALYGQSATVAQALKAYPMYQSVNIARENYGHSTYNAMEAKLQRQFSNGFSLLVSYTWAKQMSNAEDEIGSFNDGPQDTYGRQGEYVNAYTQAPNVLSATYVYDLPFGHGRKYLNHGLLATVVGGWGVSGIQRYQSGSPLYQLYAGGDPPINNGSYRPDYVPGQSQRGSWAGKFNPRVDPQVNPAAFTPPPSGQLGNVPKNLSLRSFGFYSEDLSARKDFHIWESASFQFRADFFNAFNRTNFDNINGPTTAGQPGFAIFTAQGNAPRTIQFAAKFLF